MKNLKLVLIAIIALLVFASVIIVISCSPLQIRLFIERFSGFGVVYAFLAASYIYCVKTSKPLATCATICFMSYMINYLLYLSKDLGAIYPQAMAIAFSLNTILLIAVAVATVFSKKNK